MINIVLDFDEKMAEKFGADYDYREHLEEIFPDVTSEEDTSKTLTESSTDTQDVEEGGQSETCSECASNCTEGNDSQAEI